MLNTMEEILTLTTSQKTALENTVNFEKYCGQYQMLEMNAVRDHTPCSGGFAERQKRH